MGPLTPLDPAAFLGGLTQRGFDWFAGVPCSLLGPLLALLEAQDQVPYLAATREDSALGVAAGACLAGRRPVVLMQNSGLGVSINALASLHQIYELPCLLLITWRGQGGRDAPEHVIMGPAMTALLDALDLPHRTLRADGDGWAEDGWAEDLDWADATLRETRRPCALLVERGTF